MDSLQKTCSCGNLDILGILDSRVCQFHPMMKSSFNKELRYVKNYFYLTCEFEHASGFISYIIDNAILFL